MVMSVSASTVGPPPAANLIKARAGQPQRAFDRDHPIQDQAGLGRLSGDLRRVVEVGTDEPGPLGVDVAVHTLRQGMFDQRAETRIVEVVPEKAVEQ
jgi:hypothetical protein